MIGNAQPPEIDRRTPEQNAASKRLVLLTYVAACAMVNATYALAYIGIHRDFPRRFLFLNDAIPWSNVRTATIPIAVAVLLVGIPLMMAVP